MTDLLSLKEAIFEVGLLFSKSTQPTEAQINAYARALQRYTPQQVTFAFNQVILEGKAFFPSLAEILAHLRPITESKEDRAQIIVKEIFGLIRDFHPFNELAMIEAASDDAKLVFKAMGSTTSLRDAPLDNIGTTQAQLRDLVKGVLSQKEANKKAEKLEAIGINTGRVLNMSRPDFSGFLPEPA